MLAKTLFSIWGTSGILIAISTAVHAHEGLAKTQPANAEVLTTAPSQLSFVFAGNTTITNIMIQHVGSLEDAVSLRLPRNSIGQSTAFGEQVSLPLPPLGYGVFNVSWQAITEDGHTLLDDFSFSVSSTGKP